MRHQVVQAGRRQRERGTRAGGRQPRHQLPVVDLTFTGLALLHAHPVEQTEELDGLDVEAGVPVRDGHEIRGASLDARGIQEVLEQGAVDEGPLLESPDGDRRGLEPAGMEAQPRVVVVEPRHVLVGPVLDAADAADLDPLLVAADQMVVLAAQIDHQPHGPGDPVGEGREAAHGRG